MKNNPCEYLRIIDIFRGKYQCIHPKLDHKHSGKIAHFIPSEETIERLCKNEGCYVQMGYEL